MSNTLLDNPHTNSRQSLFISTSNIWTTVAHLNNSIILNKLNYSGSQNMQMWNTRIILIPYGLKPLSINKTPFIYHHIDYSLFVVSGNQLLTWIITLVPCSQHAHNVYLWFLLCEIDQIEHISNHSHFTTPNPFFISQRISNSCYL